MVVKKHLLTSTCEVLITNWEAGSISPLSDGTYQTFDESFSTTIWRTQYLTEERQVFKSGIERAAGRPTGDERQPRAEAAPHEVPHPRRGPLHRHERHQVPRDRALLAAGGHRRRRGAQHHGVEVSIFKPCSTALQCSCRSFARFCFCS